MIAVRIVYTYAPYYHHPILLGRCVCVLFITDNSWCENDDWDEGMTQKLIIQGA